MDVAAPNIGVPYPGIPFWSMSGQHNGWNWFHGTNLPFMPIADAPLLVQSPLQPFVNLMPNAEQRRDSPADFQFSPATSEMNLSQVWSSDVSLVVDDDLKTTARNLSLHRLQSTPITNQLLNYSADSFGTHRVPSGALRDFVPPKTADIIQRSHTCGLCSMYFESEDQLIIHLQGHCLRTSFAGGHQSTKNFTIKTNHDRRSRIEKIKPIFDCPQCKRTYRHRSSLNKHMREKKHSRARLQSYD